MTDNFFTGFVRNCWYVGAWASEIAPGELIGRTIVNVPLVFYRTEDGECVALEDRCCHRLAPLSQGRCEGRDIRCLYHGMRFDPSGRCVEIPGQPNIPAGYGVKSFPMVERHGICWVWMGEQEADPDLIPAAVELDQPDCVIQSGVMPYEANYALINDNLLDFSHISYLHTTTLQGSEDWAYTRPQVTRLARGVRVSRWLPDQPPIPNSGHEGKIDFWNAYEFMVPGVMIMKSLMFPSGTAAALDFAEPGSDLPSLPGAGSACHASTPMTADQTLYFYSTIIPNRFNSDGFAAANFTDVVAALAEDRKMIEAQHSVLKLSAGSKMRATSFDNALSQYRWVLQQMIEAERQTVEEPVMA